MLEKEYFIHYFDSERSHYNIFKLFIYLRFYESEKNDPIKRAEYNAETVHEYIHYLQTFTTIYGIQTCLILFSILNDFLYDLNLSSPEFPFNNADPIFSRVNDRLNLIKNLQYFDIPNKNLSNVNDKYYEDYQINGNLVRVLFLKNHYNHQWIPITPKVIRENMAMMAYFISRGSGPDGVYEWINNRDDAEYWIIFEYLMTHSPTSLNMLIITFYVCELSLMSSIPTVKIDTFLIQLVEFINSNGSQFSDEDSLFDAYVKKYRILDDQRPWIDKLLLVAKSQNDAALKHQHENEYLQFISTFYQIIIKALEYRKTNATVFRKGLSPLWIDDMTRIFGSPVVSYRDPKIVLLGKSHVSTEPFAYIFALLYFMFNIESINQLEVCPFYKMFPICNESKPIDVCENHPLDIELDENGLGCALYNVLQLLGIKK